MKRTVFILFSILLYLPSALIGQENDFDVETREFSLLDLEELLMANHPVVRYAELISEKGRAQIAIARGNFDPNLQADFSNKYFGGTDYYNHWQSELRVPVWLAGIDLRVAYDRNVGQYANPQTRTTTAGLSGLGFSIPLGQGLLIDNRRSTLLQAEAMLGFAEAEQIQTINAIWFEAVKDYWNWYNAYRRFELLQEGVELARTRFQAIRMRSLIGDLPSIDSLEAAITVQEREAELTQYTVELKNTRLLLSNHLWGDNQQPLELPDFAVPTPADSTDTHPDPVLLSQLLALAEDEHPELLKLESKNMQLDVEERYRREMLRPKLNVSGLLISSRRRFGEDIPPQYDFRWENHRLGMQFAFPLFLRAERGRLREVRLEREQLFYDQIRIGRNISNAVTTSYNDLEAYSQQLDIQVVNINNQEVLLNGELQKFDLGESTLFLINSREAKLIDMRMKREDLISSYNKTLAELYYQAGTRL